MNRYGRIIAALITICVAIVTSRAVAADEPASDTAPVKVSFYKEIRPIFQQNCVGCHQPAKKSGGYVMTNRADLLRGGDTELAAIVPGDADESELVVQITPEEGKAAMPKDKPPLAAEQIELVRRWVAEGAEDDSPESTEDAYDMAHPPVYPQAPVVTSLDYSPDGKLLAISGFHEVLLRDAETGDIVARLVGMSERIESAVFSPDGKLLAVTGGSPGRFGEVQIWNVAERALVQSVLVAFDTLYGASWTADGTRVAFGCPDNTLRAIEAATGKQVLFQGAHNDWVLDTVFATDDSHLVSVSRDQSMKLTEVATERFVDNITSITPGALKGGLQAVDRDPKKDEVLAGGADGTPKIYKMYRTQDRKIGDDFNLIRAFDALQGRIFDVAYTIDGAKIVAVSSLDGKGYCRVYDVADGRLVSQSGEGIGPLYAAAFRPDGTRVAVSGFDGMVRILDVDTGKQVSEFPAAPVAEQTAAAAVAQ